MDIQDIIVYIIVFLCIAYAGKHFLSFFRSKGKSSGCNCGCSNCTMSAKCKDGKASTKK